MKSWLTYICLFVGCILTLPSCSPEADFDVSTDETSVELTLSYSGDGPMSRDVGSPAPDLDYTTSAQCALDVNDIFVLAFETETDANGKETLTLLDIVKDLELTKVNTDTWTIKGSMPQQGANKTIRFAVLTNLVQNGIVIGNTALDTKAAVETVLNGMIGQTATAIYEKLVYNYNASQGKWVIENRRIPMWGISEATQLNQSEINLPAMDLYRAVAKVQIWVNNKQGIAGQDGQSGTDDDFIITSIVVNNANAQGYCASLLTPNSSSAIQYEDASVPNNVSTLETITYIPEDKDVEYEIDGEEKQSFNDARESYSDFIYLPEQINTDTDAVTITINYTYNGDPMVGTIEFKENGVGDRFDVIRNHSYIFNINKIEEQTGKLYYYVTWNTEEVNIDFN